MCQILHKFGVFKYVLAHTSINGGLETFAFVYVITKIL